MDDFDFDMTVESFGQSLSPGNEQREFWGSEAADIPGSRNTIGIKDPVVDHLVDRIIEAPTPRGSGDRDPRARPGAAVGPLRDPALAQPHLPGRLLGQVRPAGDNPPYGRPCSAGGSIRSRWRRVEQRKTERGGAKAGTVE